MLSTTQRATLTLSLGAAHISFAAIFVKLIGIRTLGPSAIGFWRVFLGAIILFTWAALKKERIALPWRTMKLAIVAGALFCGDLFVWHRSIIYCGAGMATILGNTQVFVTAILSFLIFKEKLTLRYFIAAVAGMLGVVLLIGIGSNRELSGPYLQGVFLGLMTGIFYANYVVTVKAAGSHGQSGFITLMAWTSLYSSIFFLGVLGIEGEPFLPPDWFTWLILGALALVAQSLGWWLISQSLPHVDGSRAGLLLLLQPVLATVWGMVFFDERMAILQLAGAVITLSAIYYGSISGRLVKISN